MDEPAQTREVEVGTQAPRRGLSWEGVEAYFKKRGWDLPTYRFSTGSKSDVDALAVLHDANGTYSAELCRKFREWTATPGRAGQWTFGLLKIQKPTHPAMDHWPLYTHHEFMIQDGGTDNEEVTREYCKKCCAGIAAEQILMFESYCAMRQGNFEAFADMVRNFGPVRAPEEPKSPPRVDVPQLEEAEQDRADQEELFERLRRAQLTPVPDSPPSPASSASSTSPESPSGSAIVGI